METYMSFSMPKITVIPAIQRDYVQGSDRNRLKRDEFLAAIMDVLRGEDQYLNLDFIYGHKGPGQDREKSLQSNERTEFLPVDGQQRLTTLFLLGWLLKQRASVGNVDLPGLEYRTRHATGQFVRHLHDYDLPKDMDVSGERAISTHLQEVPLWFAEDWKGDPSISAMLEMLDAMNRILNEEKEVIEKMARKFFFANPLQFESVDMGSHGLNEDLYVKMNARGKALTPFENWKADFGDLLKKHYKDAIYKDGLTIPEYFDVAIEQQWCDLFWEGAVNKWNEEKDKEKKEAQYPRIDEFFMNMFICITELLFYSQTNVEQAARKKGVANAQLFAGSRGEWLNKNIARTYSRLENVETLFGLLDIFAKIGTDTGLENFFAAILTNDFAAAKEGKVNIFRGDGEPVNLFWNIAMGAAPYPLAYRVLFMGIGKRLLKYGEDCHKKAFVDYTRTLWGWILGYRNRVSETFTVDPDLRVEHIRLAASVMDKLLCEEDVFASLARSDEFDKQTRTALANEIDKASCKYEIIKNLSAYTELRGDFRSLARVIPNLPVKKCLERFQEFIDLDNEQKIKRLCEHGFTGVPTFNEHCRYFGTEGHWSYIFTSGDSNFIAAFTSWMLHERKTPPETSEMRYYMLKYEKFRNASPYCYYYKDNDFSVWARQNGKKERIGKANFCPYALTVVDSLDESIRDSLGANPVSYHSYPGYIELENYGLIMECCENGWIVYLDEENEEAREDYGERFRVRDGKVTDKKREFRFARDVLLDLDDQDRVETALAFLNAFAEAVENE